MTLDLPERALYRMPDLTFQTRYDAQDILDGMLRIVDSYGSVSVADMLELADEPYTWKDNQYGWVNLAAAYITRTREGYKTILPKQMPIGDDYSDDDYKKEKETMKRDPFTMANKFSRSSNVHMTIDGETFPVKIKNISCDSSDPFDSTSILTVEVGGHYHIPYYMINRNKESKPEIKRVIFNKPATVVFWTDDTKTVVKCGEYDEFDPEKGLAMAIAKKCLGNNYKYYETFEKYLPSEYVTKNTVEDIFKESNLPNEVLDVVSKITEFDRHRRIMVEQRNNNLVQKAYNILKNSAETFEGFDIYEVIGYLGEALE